MKKTAGPGARHVNPPAPPHRSHHPTSTVCRQSDHRLHGHGTRRNRLGTARSRAGKRPSRLGSGPPRCGRGGSCDHGGRLARGDRGINLGQDVGDYPPFRCTSGLPDGQQHPLAAYLAQHTSAQRRPHDATRRKPREAKPQCPWHRFSVHHFPSGQVSVAMRALFATAQRRSFTAQPHIWQWPASNFSHAWQIATIAATSASDRTG